MKKKISELTPSFLSDINSPIHKIKADLQSGDNVEICRRGKKALYGPREGQPLISLTVFRDDGEGFPDARTAVDEVKKRFNHGDFHGFHVEEFIFSSPN